MKNVALISTGLLLGGLQIVNAALVSNYSYDALGRLTGVSDSGDAQTEAYRYDDVGNIVEKTINGQNYRLSYDVAHQLKSAEGPEGLHEFVYDNAGRLVSEVMDGKPVVQYTYGYLDKVIAVERNGETTRFDYDASGMLVGKQLPDGSYERLTWDGMALVARGEERYINEGHVTGGLPLVSQSDEGVLYHQHDHLGTTVASFSMEGEVITVYESSVFGKGELANSRTARFTGKPYDADLGAYVFPYRNYDPESARWLSVDPSGFPDGPNNHFYAAVPTMGVDPLGLNVFDVPGWTMLGSAPPLPGNTNWSYYHGQNNPSNGEIRYKTTYLSFIDVPSLAKTASAGSALTHSYNDTIQRSTSFSVTSTLESSLTASVGIDSTYAAASATAGVSSNYTAGTASNLTYSESWQHNAIPGKELMVRVFRTTYQIEVSEYDESFWGDHWNDAYSIGTFESTALYAVYYEK